MNTAFFDGLPSTLFGRGDIAIVWLAASLPLVLTANAFWSRRSRIGLAAIYALLTVAGLLAHHFATDSDGELPLWIARSLIGTGLVGLLLTPLGRVVRGSDSLPTPTLRLVVGLVVAVAPPAVYAAAVSSSLSGRVETLLSQSRLGEAATIAKTLAVVDPTAEVVGEPIGELNERLLRDVGALRLRLPEVLPADATAGQRIDAARGWAMLGETERAIDLVAPLVQASPPDPAACNLLGTIGQNRGQWEESRFWFAVGERQWATLESSQAQAGRLAALLGIAYADRKLGRLREAETAYVRALEVSPTAGTHFLAAQFYADTQRAGDAAIHLRKAAALDPDYRGRATRLADRLMTHEFGCLPVFLDSRHTSAGTATLNR